MTDFKEFIFEAVQQWGDIGLFLFSYFESIIQPFPVDPFIISVVLMGGNVFNAVLFSSLGSILGAITAYFLGKKFGEPIVLKLFKKKHYDQGTVFFKKFGIFTILLGAASPIPFKLVVWMAGIFEMPFIPFLIMVCIGRTFRFFLVGYATDFAI